MLSEDLIGRSEGMRNVGRLIRKAAPSDSTVLITGETGVGKEVVARAIHRLSRRSEKPFVTVDCGTLVESLFESELFGHVKGAFSGAVESTVGKIGSEEHTSELQSLRHLVCRLLLEKKKKKTSYVLSRRSRTPPRRRQRNT